METIIFEDVSFAYPNTKKKALNKVNLAIHKSEFIVICGKSGCGKSTLLRQMKKNMIPYGDFEGKVTYNDVEISQMDNRISASHIGFVQQNPENQIVTDKVWHELAFGLESLGVKPKQISRRISEMASFFGIEGWFRKEIQYLSGGQKQLLNLASIMAMQPEVLILDEPTAQLDPIAASEFLKTIHKINQELGTTIILSEHRLEEVFPMADRAVVMNNGSIDICADIKTVGDFLGKAKNHPMVTGLPAPMRMFYAVGSGDICPVTVREGRLWMESLFTDPPIKEIERFDDAKENRSENAIELSDIWFRYDKNSEDILRNLSLKVKKSSWHCLVGGNGAGKSTALKIISGFLKPYRGKIKIDGEKLSSIDKKVLFPSKLGVLPQNPQTLFTEITAKEELTVLMEREVLSQKEKDKRASDMLTLLNLEGVEELHPYDLSGGEQQRLALGKILLFEPEILLLDEPTKGLDPFLKITLAKILKDLQKKGTTIFMITHDIEFCAEYADVCSMLFDGSITSQDVPAEFFGGNSFYTTAANRMSRHIFKNAVTCRDVVKLCEENLTKSN